MCHTAREAEKVRAEKNDNHAKHGWHEVPSKRIYPRIFRDLKKHEAAVRKEMVGQDSKEGG